LGCAGGSLWLAASQRAHDGFYCAELIGGVGSLGFLPASVRTMAFTAPS